MEPRFAAAILNGFVQPANAFQHISGQFAGLAPQVVTQGAAAFGNDEGQRHAHTDESRQRKQAQAPMETADKDHHDDLHQESNADGRNGVGVEYFQQFHVRRDQGNQIAFVPPFQLGRAQAAQGLKHFIPDDSQ